MGNPNHDRITRQSGWNSFRAGHHITREKFTSETPMSDDVEAALFANVAARIRWDALIKELEAEGLVERVGIRRGQIAWRITPKGREWVESRGFDK